MLIDVQTAAGVQVSMTHSALSLCFFIRMESNSDSYLVTLKARNLPVSVDEYETDE